MTQRNPLGLLGQYGYSDSDSEDEKAPPLPSAPAAHLYHEPTPQPSVPVVPVPMAMQQCPWSACYDEGTGYTYYWNQYTNAVTWEPPPEYLYAMSQAQQQVEIAGSAEVSVEEWQLYQQALAEKQLVQHNLMKTATEVDQSKGDFNKMKKDSDNSLDKNKKSLKRRSSESEDEKIELITSYQHSDTDSNDEADSPVKVVTTVPKIDTNQSKPPKNPAKKLKTKTIKYGPELPPNQNYTIPIGPELPPGITEVAGSESTKEDENTKGDQGNIHVERTDTNGEVKVPAVDETNKVVSEAQKSNHSSAATSPDRQIKEVKSTLDLDVDDLLEEIEKKELKKIKDTLADDTKGANEKEKSVTNSPKEDRYTPPKEVKPLFPSSNNISTEKCDSPPKSLFPSSADIVKNGDAVTQKLEETNNVSDKKEANIYIVDKGEVTEKASRKKLRISQSVLPEKKKGEVPSYTTKYAQCIEGNASERTGLGFNKLNEDLNDREPVKNTIAYGKGLLFTKGETLHDEKRIAEEAEKAERARADDDSDLLTAKLKFLNDQQTYSVAPVQEMTIQMQTLIGAYAAGALKVSYWQRWLDAAKDSLLRLEESAAPPGWLCEFARAECRYRYVRESDGYVQWEYPSVDDDMDICNTPPPPDDDAANEVSSYPALSPATPPPPAPAPPPPPPPGDRSVTPTPPPWHDPPPPGCEDSTPPLVLQEAPKRESIGEELRSFYDDLAELEKKSEPARPPTDDERSTTPPLKQEHRKDKDENKVHKKKSHKVKISSSVGLKHKTVSNLVAKWRQVADEIHSD